MPSPRDTPRIALYLATLGLAALGLAAGPVLAADTPARHPDRLSWPVAGVVAGPDAMAGPAGSGSGAGPGGAAGTASPGAGQAGPGNGAGPAGSGPGGAAIPPGPVPHLQPFAGQLTGVVRTPGPNTGPAAIPEGTDGCDHAYGDVGQCVPWQFPPGVVNRCGWLAAHGFKPLAVHGRDRHGLDRNHDGVACGPGDT